MFASLRLAALISFLGLAVSAVAAERGAVDSEFLHQAADGKLELTPGIGQEPGQTSWSAGGSVTHSNGYGMSTFKYRKPSGLGGTYSVVPVLVGVEYGLNSMLSLGMNLGYGSGTFSYTGCTGNNCNGSKTRGLFDPVLFLKGRTAAGPGTLIFGAYMNLSIEKSKTDSSGDSNVASGGSSLTPFVGYQIAAGPGVAGARFQADFYNGDRKSHADPISGGSSASDSTTTGGGAMGLDAFYEAGFGMVTLGGDLFYNVNRESKTALNSSAATGNKDSASTMGVQIYAPVHLESFTVLPQLTYMTQSYSASDSAVSSANVLVLGASARFTF